MPKPFCDDYKLKQLFLRAMFGHRYDSFNGNFQDPTLCNIISSHKDTLVMKSFLHTSGHGSHSKRGREGLLASITHVAHFKKDIHLFKS